MHNSANHPSSTRPTAPATDDVSLDIALDIADLEAPVAWDIDYPSWRADEILPGLYMGGTHDDRTVADPMPLRGLGARREYDAVVTLYAWAQPVGLGGRGAALRLRRRRPARRRPGPRPARRRLGVRPLAVR